MAALAGGVLVGVKLIDKFIKETEGKVSFEVDVEGIKTETIPVHCDLAASYGKLKTDSGIKEIDDKLKIMIAGTVRAINMLEVKSWENVVACMMQNTLIEPVTEEEVFHSDKFIHESFDICKSGKPDEKTMKLVRQWFTELISDPDVLENSHIAKEGIDVLAKIVAQSGATVNSFATVFYKHEYHERTMLEMGVIQFPDIETAYFKLYRIKLIAWSDCSRVMLGEKNFNGITGEYNCKKFKPRDSIISALTKNTRERAISEAESLPFFAYRS